MTDLQITKTLATEVMGWKLTTSPIDDEFWADAEGKFVAWRVSWDPTQNLTHAWQLVDKVGEKKITTRLTKRAIDGRCLASFKTDIKLTARTLEIWGEGETPQEAICNSAMKLIERGYLTNR
ncbi:hypothetical protein ACFYU8_29965 [Brevibacillus sp. NPDC003359]|uniref:BC1872 family protein n=1 Tax=unclassified Brevibacillus TaxID=2684853 RepID=UPI0036B35749